MAIVKAAIGEVAFNIGQPIQVGVAFLDSGGNTVDIQVFPLPIAPYATRAAAMNAIGTQVIAYAATQGATLTGTDIISIY